MPLLKSIDGGKTFNAVKGPHHGDHHDLWIDPKNPQRMIDSNDGGVDITTNGGETWYAPPLPISQFYHINVRQRVPYHVMGTMQDLGTACGPEQQPAAGGITLGDWHDVGGGETGFSRPRPERPEHRLRRRVRRLHLRATTTAPGRPATSCVYPVNPSGHGAEDLKYRFQWTAPIADLAARPARSSTTPPTSCSAPRDGGKTWETISQRPDAQRQEQAEMVRRPDHRRQHRRRGLRHHLRHRRVAEAKGRPLGRQRRRPGPRLARRRQDLDERHDQNIAEPARVGHGLLHRAVALRRGHRLRRRRRPPARRHAAVPVQDDRLRQDLEEPHRQDCRRTMYLHVVREDPKKKGLLYRRHRARVVAYSPDDGATWQPLKLNLPTVAVTTCIVKDNDLVVGTKGRSLWILDDLTPIREWTTAMADKPGVLLPIQPAVRWRLSGGFPYTDRGEGENPPFGAFIYYFVAKKPSKPATLEIRDAQDKLVVTFTAKEDKDKDDDDEGPEGDIKEPKRLIPHDTGEIIRFAWNLSYPGAEFIPKAQVDSGDPTAGPLVPPGDYMAKLSVEGLSQSQKFTVKPDPRGPADLKGQHEFVMKVRDDFAKLVGAVQQLQAVRKQLRERNELVELVAKAEPLVKASNDLIAKLDALEEKLHNPKAKVTYDIFAAKGGAKLYSQYAFLFDVVKDGDGPPTQGDAASMPYSRPNSRSSSASFRGLLAAIWRNLMSRPNRLRCRS